LKKKNTFLKQIRLNSDYELLVAAFGHCFLNKGIDMLFV